MKLKDGTYGSAANTHYAVSLLKNTKDVLENDVICSFCQAQLNKKTVHIQDVFHLTSIMNTLNCVKAVPAFVEDVLKEELGSDSFEDLYYALHSLSILKKFNAVSGSLSSKDAVHTLAEGDFSQISADSISFAFRTAALLISDPQVSKSEKKELKALSEEIATLFDLVEEDGPLAEFSAGETDLSNFATTCNALIGIGELARVSGKKFNESPELFTKLLEYILTNKKVTNLEDAFYFVQATHASQDTTVFPSPLVLRLARQAISTDDEDHIEVLVTDLKGDFVDVPEVKLIKVIGEDKKSVSHALTLKKTKNAYLLNVAQLKLAQGVSKLFFTIPQVPQGYLPVQSAMRAVKILNKVSIEGFKISVYDVAGKRAPSITKIASPNKVLSDITVGEHEKIQFSFQLQSSSKKSIMAHQVFLRFLSHATKKEALFVVPFTSKSIYSLVLDFAGEAGEVFGRQQGRYDVSLFVGDLMVSNSIAWDIATISLEFSSKFDRPSEPARESIYTPKPDQDHVFGIPEERPPYFIWSTFTALIWLALPVFLILLSLVGANCSGLPSGTAFLVAVGFIISLGLILLLIINFWLGTNLFDTFSLLILPLIFAVLLGQKLLSSISLF
eukprot:GCRY01002704.1.p1 GENE.GCRY01002704.1~~GCRY01002704.1.p1  ORF type:complete len:615 (-),score=117.77 GCRY01002704.1:268-2112(-)